MCRQILMQVMNVKFRFHENQSGLSRIVPCGQIGGRTNVTKLLLKKGKVIIKCHGLVSVYFSINIR